MPVEKILGGSGAAAPEALIGFGDMCGKSAKDLRSKGFFAWFPGRAAGTREPCTLEKVAKYHFFDNLKCRLSGGIFACLSLFVAYLYAAKGYLSAERYGQGVFGRLAVDISAA